MIQLYTFKYYTDNYCLENVGASTSHSHVGLHGLSKG
jgi:hypothetical protein